MKKSALIFALEPVFAALTAALFADEVLVSLEWLGGALILIGMVVAELGDGLFHREAVELVLAPHKGIPMELPV